MPDSSINVVTLGDPEAAAPFVAVLALTRGLHWRGSAERQERLLELVGKVRPDVVLERGTTRDDHELEGLVQRVADRCGKTRVIVVRHLNGGAEVEACLEAGASGVLSRNAASYEIVCAIKHVGYGRVVLCTGARLLLEMEEARKSDTLVSSAKGNASAIRLDTRT